MMFIDLNELIKNGEALKPISINAFNIQSLQKANRSTDTLVVMMNGKFYFVNESVAAIKKLIGRG